MSVVFKKKTCFAVYGSYNCSNAENKLGCPALVDTFDTATPTPKTQGTQNTGQKDCNNQRSRTPAARK